MGVCIGIFYQYDRVEKVDKPEIVNTIEVKKDKLFDPKLINDIKKREGFRGYAYKCSAGNITIGYGTNIDQSAGNPLDTLEAEMLLINRLKQCEIFLIDEFTTEYFKFNDNRKYVLYQMMFMLGSTRFSKFDKFIHHIKKMDFKSASKELRNSKLRRQIRDIDRFCKILETGKYIPVK